MNADRFQLFLYGNGVAPLVVACSSSAVVISFFLARLRIVSDSPFRYWSRLRTSKVKNRATRVVHIRSGCR